MKKALVVLYAVAILLLLVACGGAEVSSGGSTGGSDGAAPASEPIEETGSNLTMGQQQAVAKAQEYLDFAAFSNQGLVDQLVYEGFSKADATFAVDYIAPDWNAQAAQKAQEYLDMSSFSRQGLIDQLVFEGFTQAQAEYGAKAVGY